ncbi:MAG: SDR family oxidoreductase [Thermoplasmata archaeon]
MEADVRALITGASQGIGRATARRLAGPGSELLLGCRTHLAAAEELARELTARGGQATALAADLGVATDVDRLAEETGRRFRGLDALVLNAGSYPRVAFDAMTDEEFDRCLAVNLTGPARLTRRLLPLLRSSSSGARIVCVASILAFTGSRRGAHYAAAKAGLIGLARSLALELAPSITVNVVAPGSIDTAILASDTPERRAAREAEIPLGRVGTAEEVAEAIGFLLSPAASYITGTTVHVNGGLLRS